MKRNQRGQIACIFLIDYPSLPEQPTQHKPMTGATAGPGSSMGQIAGGKGEKSGYGPDCDGSRKSEDGFVPPSRAIAVALAWAWTWTWTCPGIHTYYTHTGRNGSMRRRTTRPFSRKQRIPSERGVCQRGIPGTAESAFRHRYYAARPVGGAMLRSGKKASGGGRRGQ